MSYLNHSPDENELLKIRKFRKIIFRKPKYGEVQISLGLLIYAVRLCIFFCCNILAIEIMNSRELQWSFGNNIPVTIENIQNINRLFFLRMCQD